MNDQLDFSEIVARLDKACEKMNAGLAAIATVLAVLVIFMSLIRVSEAAIDLGVMNSAVVTASGDQAPTFWTYY